MLSRRQWPAVSQNKSADTSTSSGSLAAVARPVPSPGVLYDQWMFNRALLLWAHIILAIVAALLYLSSTDLTHFAYWRRGASAAPVMIAAIRTFPA
jgi:hypothetical protein